MKPPAAIVGALLLCAVVMSCGLRFQSEVSPETDVHLETAAMASRKGDQASDGGTIDKSATAESSTVGDGAKSVTVAGGGDDSVTSMILAAAALVAALGDGPLRRMWRDRRGGMQAEVDELKKRIEQLERPGRESNPGAK